MEFHSLLCILTAILVFAIFMSAVTVVSASMLSSRISAHLREFDEEFTSELEETQFTSELGETL